MKPDEEDFFRLCCGLKRGQFPRDVPTPGMAPKRKQFLLAKWARKGWYDYGVSLDLGWITKDGQTWLAYLDGPRS